jgi:thioredoxin reductase (NADPH)
LSPANSAGQAAVFLSAFAAKISMLVRANSLASSMSRYLIERIEARPNIVPHRNRRAHEHA